MTDASLVRFSEVSKSYRSIRGRRHQALDGFSMTIPQGKVVGLLGPNGSGKTTALKCLLGLIRPDSGQIHAFGYESPAGQRHIAPRIGALIEGPAFTGALTGRRNLELLADLRAVDRDKTDEVLDLVGMTGAAGKLYRSYSLGMKQRLGVAAALLSDPELLVLDEPMNGLDPQSVHEMRDLLGRLRDERGVSMVFSSHILAEAEQVCDWVAIMEDGRCIRESAMQELLDTAGVAVVVRLPETAEAGALLSGLGFQVDERPGGELRIEDTDESGKIVAALSSAGLHPHEVFVSRATLEESYLLAVETYRKQPDGGRE